MANARADQLKAIPYQVFLLCLSVYVLLALLAEVTLPLRADVVLILSIVDNAICVIFLGDFVVRLLTAPSKTRYLRWGWIDLISSIPMLDALRWGRAFRLARLVRVMRSLRSIRVVLAGCLKLKAQSAFLAAFLASILMLVVGSNWVLLFEQAGQGNLNNGADALWWAVTTMTTVGYGDYYPVTTGGRVIAAMLMVTGVGLFGSFTGFVASWLVEDEFEEDQQQLDEMHEEIIRLREAVERLSRKLEAD